MNCIEDMCIGKTASDICFCMKGKKESSLISTLTNK